MLQNNSCSTSAVSASDFASAAWSLRALVMMAAAQLLDTLAAERTVEANISLKRMAGAQLPCGSMGLPERSIAAGGMRSEGTSCATGRRVR